MRANPLNEIIEIRFPKIEANARFTVSITSASHSTKSLSAFQFLCAPARDIYMSTHCYAKLECDKCNAATDACYEHILPALDLGIHRDCPNIMLWAMHNLVEGWTRTSKR